MKITIRKQGVKNKIQEADSFIIGLKDGRALDIEKETLPRTVFSGFTILGGAIQEANSGTLNASTRPQCLGIYSSELM